METPTNLATCWQFWLMPSPFGIIKLSRCDKIDWDEAAIFVEMTDRGYGKAFVGTECIKVGPYRHSKKFTLTVAIEGGDVRRRWIRWSDEAGTEVRDVLEFVEEVINEVEHGTQPRRRTFLADNHAAHKHKIVWQLIQGRGHRFIPRAPYAARDGPSELVFNYIEQQLTLEFYKGIQTPAQLKDVVKNILAGVTTFDLYFASMGYPL